MKPLSKAAGVDLHWFSSGRRHMHHELLGSDGEAYATLSLKGGFSSKATAASAEGEHELRWRGFLRRRVTVHDTVSGQGEARLELGLGDSGSFQLPSGQSYKLKRTGLLRPKWAVLNDLDMPVFTVSCKGWLALSGKVWMNEGARANRDLPLLLIISRFAITMIIEEETGAVMASGF